MNDKKVDSKSNFGAKGWLLILYLFLGFFMSTSLGADLLNVIIPAFCTAKGWDPAGMYGFVTISGIITVLAVVVLSAAVRKIGPRNLAIIGLIVSIIVSFLRPHVTTLGQYNLLFVITSICLQAVVYISAGAITASWFPRKKGLVMGWATMGAAFSTIISSLAFNKLLVIGGLQLAFYVWALIPIIMLLLVIFFVRNNPEERGFNPDNDQDMTPEMARKLHEEGLEYEKTSPWTLKKLLTTRYAWLVGIGTGPLLMISVGVMSSIVNRCVTVGFSMEQAIITMSLVGVIGIVASYVWGLIDTKFGTKVATNLIYLWLIISLILNIIGSKSMPIFIFSLVMFACFIGGSNNMPVSMIASVFGRYDYTSAYRVIWPIVSIIMSFGFTAVGALAAMLGGSYTISYLGLIIVSVVGIICTTLLPKECIGRK